MRYRRLGLALMFLVVATLSCGPITDLLNADDGKPDDGGGDVVPTGAPPPPTTAAEATVPSPPTQRPSDTVPDGSGLDWTLSPNFGSESLNAGFSPDPYTVAMVSGGSVDVWGEDLGPGCTGYTTNAPDFRINWSGSTSRLRIFFVGEGGDDTTLVVNDAAGNWQCDDDYFGFHPMVELSNPASGQMDIWVGSYGSGEFVNGTLYVTELSYDPGNLPGGSGTTPGGSATVTINNNSSDTICYVRISPTSDTTWGEDQLGGSETIAPGGGRAFNVSGGEYDLRAEDCSNNEIDVEWGVNVSGSYTWNVSGGGAPPPPPPGGSATLNLNNGSSDTICYVRISPTSATTWGEDQLSGTETVAPGGSRSFSISAGEYDIRAEDCSNNEIDVEWGVTISGSYTWNVGGGGAPPPPPPASSGGLDYTQPPNFGSASLSAGFSNDPYTVGMTSGGSVDVWSESLGSGCTGYSTSAPDFRLQWSGSSSQLRIFFVPTGSDDTTIIVNTASGQWRCNDDYSGLDPMVELSNPSSGQYDIWVGSYSSGDYVGGTLYITELSYDPSDF